ncbi:3-deoxy-7-phosphoheptulonate synthase [Glycomyces sp. TRM65418]|uniref:3-deoxy-7-phosphoheptulonate synthase n=1 Tax=Glycomyces sp. TRM65418 TaxID=2867006 RepID=UPI001CE60004|nr:3-deoxy-7-phosphoheptulonate synthase [Glycomyces sp. TRM65418]MCC3761590.1 3-deoxy-7-phosphoheptulonate synthase [Glycomyces sp. TRM65418]QZD55685.1 3-deoxy-7-phosphoheptulonate synthase [Glycomyces sp. TRM65418]
MTTVDLPLRTGDAGPLAEVFFAAVGSVTGSAAQQPQWAHHPDFPAVVRELSAAPPLVPGSEVLALRRTLAEAARGRARLLQAGDCAESFYECTVAHTRAKAATVHRIAERLAERTGDRVIRIGRIAGQYAKPRSQDFETVDGARLPSFRGHMINGEVPDAAARRHDPRRMLWAYQASARVMDGLRELPVESALWTSHEALVLDYEMALLRATADETGARGVYIGSTHLPWIGKRTAAVDGAHVRFLSGVLNPVGYKVGPDVAAADLVRLCAALDRDRSPGRLVLISRMGAGRIAERLPRLVAAVREAGHPVVWLCDPMHGNTTTATACAGRKTRHLDDLIAEVRAFESILRDAGVPSGGLHLETAGEAVTECLGGNVSDEAMLRRRYTTLCDPRLNPDQAAELVDACYG